MSGWERTRGLSFFAAMLVASSARAATEPGAAALEARLHAPCCYEGTLDHHDSELARDLRMEIEGRLARGESSDAIQADFVARYGEEVLAARSDAPIKAMGLSLALAGALAGAAVLVVMKRRVRRRDSAPGESETSPEPDAMDARIDAELADVD